MNELSGCWGDGSAFLLGMTCKERRKKKLESSGTGYGGGGGVVLAWHGVVEPLETKETWKNQNQDAVSRVSQGGRGLGVERE